MSAAIPLPEPDEDVRFVECQCCEGEGEVQTGTATIYDPGCGFHREDAIMEPCPECDGTGRAETPVSPIECDDLDAAIAALVADRLPGMREREREAMCAKVERKEFPEWLRTRELGLLCGLMFVGVLGVSWVANMRLAGAF